MPAIISMLCNPSVALQHQLVSSFSSVSPGCSKSLWTPCELVTSLIPLFLSRSYTDMLFNTGLSNPHQILLWNLLHCKLGPYLCPLCCIFSLVTDSEECVLTCTLTTQMLNSLWWGACSKPFENQTVYTSKTPTICLHTNVSFLWFEVSISHFMWTLNDFLACLHRVWRLLLVYKCQRRSLAKSSCSYMSVYWISLS